MGSSSAPPAAPARTLHACTLGIFGPLVDVQHATLTGHEPTAIIYLQQALRTCIHGINWGIACMQQPGPGKTPAFMAG